MRTRPNLLLALVFVLVLILAAGTALFASNQRQPDYDLGTPEGVAYAYTVAVLENDSVAVQELLAPDTRCDLTGPESQYMPTSQSAQVRVQQVDLSGNTAEVAILIDQSDGLYDSWQHQENIRLKLVDGTWMVDDGSWPFYGCE